LKGNEHNYDGQELLHTHQCFDLHPKMKRAIILPSQMAELCEPWFLALNAEANWSPVMVPSDLQKAAPAVEEAVKRYA
jgi:hypothetical protein